VTNAAAAAAADDDDDNDGDDTHGNHFEAVTILSYASFRLMLPYAQKLNLLNKQYFYHNTVYCVSKVKINGRSAVFRPRHRPTFVCRSFMNVYSPVDRHTLFKVSQPLQTSAVSAVVMETTQLVLSQFKNFYRSNFY